MQLNLNFCSGRSLSIAMQAKHWIHWVICLVASPIILFGWRTPSSPSDDQLPRRNTHPVYSKALHPTYEEWIEDPPKVIGLGGTNFVWQIPAVPVGVLFLAHGCNRNAMVYWDAHSGCPTCSGLPEERAFAIEALQRGFALIAISSTDVCWNVRDDMHNVESVLREWIDRKGLRGLPVVALGSSTGGWFVSRLANQFRFDAIVLMVAEGRFNSAGAGNFSSVVYPPVMFVHMPKDEPRARQIRVDMAHLMARGVKVAEHLCHALPVSADFFSLRIPYFDNSTSVRMVEALVANRTLTDEGLMKQDARWCDWSLPLEERDLLPAQLRAHVEQELNVAYAFHEFSSLAAPQIFLWFELHIQARSFMNPAPLT